MEQHGWDLGTVQRRLSIATEAARIGLWDWNVVTGEMVYSHRAKLICGFDTEGPVTLDMVRAVTHPDDLSRTWAMSERAMDPAIRAYEPYRYRIVRADRGEVRLCEREGVVAMSSNYALYGDMSRRMNQVYSRFSPDVEIYSIDESFIDVSRLPVRDRTDWASDLRSTTRQWTGIPTCVGIGPTKTLAKLANKAAKTLPGGVLDLSDPFEQKRVLETFPIGSVWGIGRASQFKLNALGIRCAGEVRDMDTKLARQILTVVGERIVHELNGKPCIALETVAPQRKGCAVTRSFGQRVTTKLEMEHAVAGYATRLGEKLRRHELATDHVTVFMHTSPFAEDEPQRSVSLTIDIPEATNDTLALIKAARRAVDRLWQSGFRYSKAGIVTQDLVRPPIPQRALFDRLDHERAARAMAAMDEANRRWGRATVIPAAVGIAAKSAFTTKFDMRSPRYTTRWDELPKVN